MREFKFRGINPYSKQMVYGFFVNHENYPQIWKEDSQDKGSFPVIVDIETLGQYTGFNDSFGIPIFEGDIIDGGDYKGIVHWEQKKGRFNIKIGDDIENGLCEMGMNDFGDLITNALDCVYVDIIGNIYQNPELS